MARTAVTAVSVIGGERAMQLAHKLPFRVASSWWLVARRLNRHIARNGRFVLPHPKNNVRTSGF
jgi:hypothetical protein